MSPLGRGLSVAEEGETAGFMRRVEGRGGGGGRSRRLSES
ncbi:hypothetical protein A2U01_0112462, partial [Trifolium medium]|nr:hypothetical protein [Trifolium medium]